MAELDEQAGTAATCAPDPHVWVANMRGGEPIYIDICMGCGQFNWDGLREQVEVIVAATRRQDDAVLLDTVIGHQPGPDACACGYDAGGHGAHVIERYQSARTAAIARGRGETQQPPTH